MSTEAPLGSPSSLIGPLYVDSAARPMLNIARYITAPPAAVPMSARRSRLRIFVASRSDIIRPPWVLCPSRVILTATLDRRRRMARKQRTRLTFEKLHAPRKRRLKKAGPRRSCGQLESENERLLSRVGRRNGVRRPLHPECKADGSC